MNGFSSLSNADLQQLLSINGAIQIAIVVANIILALLLSKLMRIPIKSKWGIVGSMLKATTFYLSYALIGFMTAILFAVITNTKVSEFLTATIFIVIVMAVIRFVSYIAALPMPTKRGQNFVRNVSRTLMWIYYLLGAFHFKKPLVAKLKTVSFEVLNSQTNLWKLIDQGSGIAILIFMMIWLIAVGDHIIRKIPNLDDNLRQLFSRSMKIIVVVILGLVWLPKYGVDLTALTVLGGGIGIGIGFGLQKIASNFLSGFIILLDRSVKIGDRIVIDGTTGTISKITMRYVVMQAFNGSEVIIPNEKFITDTIVNQTYSNSDLSIELVISVGYNSDLRRALEIIQQTIINSGMVQEAKTPTIFVQKFADSGIEIFMRVWPKDALTAAGSTKNELYIQIFEQFRTNGIEIPFPQLDVHLIKSS